MLRLYREQTLSISIRHPLCSAYMENEEAVPVRAWLQNIQSYKHAWVWRFLSRCQSAGPARHAA